ncbi:MAG: hypothetical protein QXR19_15505 [Candidatus Jordarchaeaceae archaeon]
MFQEKSRKFSQQRKPPSHLADCKEIGYIISKLNATIKREFTFEPSIPPSTNSKKYHLSTKILYTVYVAKFVSVLSGKL